MKRTLLFVASTALIGVSACNQSSRDKASEKTSEIRKDADEAMQDIKKDAQAAAADVKDEAAEAAKDIKENAAEARKDIASESGKAGNAIRDGVKPDNKGEAGSRADRASDDAGTEARQTTRDAKTEARQTSRDAKTEARQTARDVKTEARQTNRDLHEALGMDQGKTEADKRLNEKIRAALKTGKLRDAGDVTLETAGGHVKLKGTVSSEDSKKEIASAARKVAGLTHVTDDLKVAERVGQGADD